MSYADEYANGQLGILNKLNINETQVKLVFMNICVGPGYQSNNDIRKRTGIYETSQVSP